MAKSDFVAADEAKLDEIIRQAESRLAAQLDLAIAADARAMTFCGILGAAAAALVAYAAEKGMSWSVLGMIISLCIGAAAAAWAAQPIAWSIVGTSPSDWIEDIAAGKDDLLSAKAAMASHYAEMVDANTERSADNSNYVRAALVALIMTPILGGLGLLLN